MILTWIVALASSCSGSSKNSTLTLTNASPTATTTAYFLVEYSTDNGSTYEVAESSKSVAIDGSETVTQAVHQVHQLYGDIRLHSLMVLFLEITQLYLQAILPCATPEPQITKVHVLQEQIILLLI